MIALVNTSRAVSVRLVTPWRGVWFAEVDLDPEDAAAPPEGAVTLTIGSAKLSGTVDPRSSGRFASSVQLRIVGGAAGWDKPVRPQHFHNDAGVKSSVVYGATAREVGETVNDPSPTSLGLDFVRSAGAASRVFGDGDWYVDVAGITQIGARPALVPVAGEPDVTIEVLGFDPNAQRLELSTSAVVLPGTRLTDPRFDGELVVRDVEQTFTADGARATVWCAASASSPLGGALGSMVRELAGVTYLRLYAYRFISATGSRLNLQAVDKGPGLPDVVPIPVFPGMAGLTAKLTASQTVLVAFLEGDPKQPVVVGFDGNLPREVTVDATDAVNLGGEGGAAATSQGDAIVAYLPPELPVAGTVSGAPFAGTITIAVPLIGVVQGGSSKVRVVK